MRRHDDARTAVRLARGRGPTRRAARAGRAPRSARRGRATSGRGSRAAARATRWRWPPDIRRTVVPREAVDAEPRDELVDAARGCGVQRGEVAQQRQRPARRRQPALLEHHADPGPVVGPGAPRVGRRAPAPAPASGRCRPSRHSTVVVLPAPFGPSTRGDRPGAGRPRRAVDGGGRRRTTCAGRAPALHRPWLDILGWRPCHASTGRPRPPPPWPPRPPPSPSCSAARGRRPLLGRAPGRRGRLLPRPRPHPRPRPVPGRRRRSSPADGKVMHAGAGQEGVAPEGEWQQVSIFLSAFDVHINRTPYGGRVVEVVERPGQVARRLQARERPPQRAQRHHRRAAGRRRAAPGALPPDRRPDGPPGRHPGVRGRRARHRRSGSGLMKFGSRMDVFVPPGVRPARLDAGTASSPARPSSPAGRGPPG